MLPANQQSPSSPPQTFTSQTPPQPQYHYFRGHKKRISELNKTKMLKTKRVKDKEQKVLRHDVADDEEFLDVELVNNQEMHESKRFEETTKVNSQRRAKSHFQIMKLNPVDKLWSIERMKRNFSSTDEHQLMIRTSRMQISCQQTRNTPKPLVQLQNETSHSSQQPLTRFYSKNLQQRMNEYLNMVVGKSSRDHQQKVKKIKEQEEGKDYREIREQKQREVSKMFVKNKFLRELKTRTNLKKKYEQQNHSIHGNNLNCQQNNNPITSRDNQQSARTESKQLNYQLANTKNFSHSRISSYQNHNNHNISSNNNKMIQGDELINFASEVLSKSLKIYSHHQYSSRTKQKSLRRLNYSVQVERAN